MGTRPAIRFTLDGARRGALAMLPILPGAVAFAVLWGFLAGEKGLGTLEVAAMSALGFAVMRTTGAFLAAMAAALALSVLLGRPVS